MAVEFVPSDPGPVPTLPQPAPPPETSDTFAAAFRQGNLVVSAISALRNSGPVAPVDGYSAWDDIKDDPEMLPHAGDFAGFRSPGETEALKGRIRQENADKRTLAASGGMGVVASMTAGALDPTMLLPGRVAIGVAKDGTALVRGAMEIGGAMAVQSTVQEMGLQATQETRPLGESVLAVGSATLLSGLLGGALGMLSKGEQAALVAGLDRDRAAMDAHATGRTGGARVDEHANGPAGFTAYHGSPHDFDQFDTGKIGTGEGSNTRGNGIYLAEHPQTGDFYKEFKGKGGILYQARVKADKGAFIDWDRSLSEQPPHVQNLAKELGIEDAASGQKLVDEISNKAVLEEIEKRGGDWQSISPSEVESLAQQRMRRAGIPGVKYLDAGSRDAGAGSRNYVVFSHNDVDITHKNGIALEQPSGPSGGLGLATSGGAAATDTRALEPVRTGIGLEKLPTDPVLRTYQQPSVAARRGIADLAETAVLMKENLEGKTTTSGGAPLETIFRTQNLSSQAVLNDRLMAQWGDLRFGGKAPVGARMRDFLGMSDRGAAPTFEEFKAQVSDAMMNGDKSEVPQVQAAAQQMRAHMEPWVARAEAALPEFERLTPKEGEGYFPHAWNKPQIQARRPEFVNKLVEKYASDQTAKRGAQERLQAYSNGLEAHEATIKKLTNRLESKRLDLEQDEALRDEVSRINKFAFQRATALRESEFKNVGGIQVPAPGKNIEKARGGAVFETKVRERGNTLADRASAHAADVDELEGRLNQAHADAAEVRTKIEAEIGKWEGKSAAEAKSTLKAREKYEADRAAKAAPSTRRLASADDAVDRAVKRILASDRNKSVEDLRSIANETVDRLLSSPDGRLPYDETAGVGHVGPQAGGEPMRGSLAGRLLDVSNEFARDWVERDVEKVLHNFNRTFMPDVLLAERFGDIAMEDVFRRVNEEYAALIDATKSEAERTKLGKLRDRTIEDLAATRDRFRGLYNIPTTESQRRIGRISGAVRNAMVPLNLGMAAVSSIPDAAGPVFQWGMASAFRDGWLPFVKSVMSNREYSKEALREAKVAGIAIDTFTAARHHELAGIADGYHPQSPVERTLQWGADKMQLANGLAYWTDLVKTISMTVNSANLYRSVKAAAAGSATKKQMMELGAANIPSTLYEKIAEQYETSGTKIDGITLPNTEAWTRETREVFEGALSRNANINVVTPGLDKPLFMSDPTWAVLTQFKSFTAAAHTRILIANLQRADAQTLQGIVASLALGMVSYKFNAIVGGAPTSDRPQDWIKEAAARGSLFGWLEEGNALASKMTRGGLDMYRMIGSDKPLSRYAGRSVTDQLLGPTFGKLVDLSKVTGATAARDWSADDVKAVRRFIPAQNLFYLRGLFNQVEAGADTAFGMPQKAAH